MLIAKERGEEKLVGLMTWSLMWLNRNVVTINTTFQLLDIYIYIYNELINVFMLIFHVYTKNFSYVLFGHFFYLQSFIILKPNGSKDFLFFGKQTEVKT